MGAIGVALVLLHLRFALLAERMSILESAQRETLRLVGSLIEDDQDMQTLSSVPSPPPCRSSERQPSIGGETSVAVPR